MADDSLCRKCGKCCYEKFVIQGVVVITDIPCEHLDTGTCLCRIYADRHRLNPRCQPAAAALRAGALAGDCPYVKDIPGYQAPVDIAAHPEYADLLAEELLKEQAKRQGRG
jgi:uncharacterized cysteine cluster protein YcgN (CxxCxxCC family)